MSLRMTILGCGSSGGVPRIGNNWGACDPQEPRNRRLRCSLLVERCSRDGHAAPDRSRAGSPRAAAGKRRRRARWRSLDAEHADRTHGIDELRVVADQHEACRGVCRRRHGSDAAQPLRLLLCRAAEFRNIRPSSRSAAWSPASPSRSMARAARSRRCRSPCSMARWR